MAMPTVAYFLSTREHPMGPSHPRWSQPLPLRRWSNPDREGRAGGRTVSYADYFGAVHHFCAKDGWERLASICAATLQRPIIPTDIDGINIHLVKHGAFYHPAQLCIVLGEDRVHLVVNVALSDQGRRTLPGEVRTLRRLAEERPFGWLPMVYDHDEENLPMFLADWFDDFHEFHLTGPADSADPDIMLWDGAATPRLLDDQQIAGLYRQAAMILTTCYDPVSTNHIRQWHHAAGDFVLRLDGDRATVRLITARDYGPLIERPAGRDTAEALVEALLLFFIDLSLRMRLDRMDGVSTMAWAPDNCLEPIVRGFFQGLDLTARLSGLPDDFVETVRRCFKRIPASRLRAVAEQVAARAFADGPEDRPIVRRHLDDHVGAITRALSSRRPG